MELEEYEKVFEERKNRRSLKFNYISCIENNPLVQLSSSLIPRSRPPNIRYIVSSSCWTMFKYPPHFDIFLTVILHEILLNLQLIAQTN